METILLQLLKDLQSIEAQHDGLGETNVRGHMMKDVFRGFFLATPGFSPSGEYGLTPEANALVGAALARFCKAAGSAARRDGLSTFHQRLAAFQNRRVQTAGGSNFEDYFGSYDPGWFDDSGNDLRRAPSAKPLKPAAPPVAQRACDFDLPGGLDNLLLALNRVGNWTWRMADDGPLGDPSLETNPEAGIRVQIRDGLENLEADGSSTPPEHAFMALVEASEDRVDEVDVTFHAMLVRLRATNVTKARPYDW